MNEQQRQDYLKVMGIEPFYLKKVLPAAKQSPNYDFPEIAPDSDGRSFGLRGAGGDEEVHPQPFSPARDSTKEKVPNSSNSRMSSDTNGRRTKIDALKAELTQTAEVAMSPAAKESRKEAANPAQDSPKTAPKADAAEIVEFKIRFLHINAELAVIDELPFVEADAFPPANNELLKAILAALKVNWNDDDIRSESFSWPIDAAFDFHEDPKLAAELMLKGFIAQHHGANPFANLLVFAGQLESVLESSKANASGCDYVEPSQGYHVTVTSTLTAMLAYPLLKKQVWAALQPLRRRLAKIE